MYTQCPDCSTAFRVTANVLKQAAGKVRCGGCGHAFNALDYLSESLPEQPTINEPQASLPELTPEPLAKHAGLPESISAAQSAALLKTLDQLAGSNIRIEDTGVEWRVLDDDEFGDSPVDDRQLEGSLNDAAYETAPDYAVFGDGPVDELLDDSPTPIDQFLADTPNEVDAAEIFDETANGPASTPVEELRFDDNTPLPEDFGFSDGPSDVPAATRRVEDPEPAPLAEAEPVEELQADLELSDPDEWEDLLGEVDELIGAIGPDDGAGDERPGHADEDLTEMAGIDETDAVLLDDERDPGDDSVDELLDMDTQFALQAEAMGIDLSGRHATRIDVDDRLSEEDLETAAVYVDEDLELEAETDQPSDADDDYDDDDERVLGAHDVDDDAAGEELDSINFELDLDATADDDEETVHGDIDDDFDADLVVRIADEFDVDEAVDAADEDKDEEDDDIRILLDDERDEPRKAEPYVPPMTEEEQTINMMIDQDLMSMAVEDEDGFASTIIMPGQDAADMVAEEQAMQLSAADETGTGFETIIMEGEFVRSELDKEKLAADAAAAAVLAKEARAREAERAAHSGRRNYGLIGGAMLLLLLLVAQVLHFSRDALATNPGFNDLVGSMYRSIGKPLSPAWDIAGWRFEVTRGNADETTNSLTIFSRIGNKSDKPLPYPLIGISLTDRFEEVVGSRVLEPADYLTDDLDPRKLVQPGNTFNAVMTIRSPSPEATGFKLNVCYRVSGGQLRCAIQDFR